MKMLKLKYIMRIWSYSHDGLLILLTIIFKVITLDLNYSPSRSKDPQRILAILGNGPSFKNDWIEIQKMRPECDFCAVNNFANTEFFNKLNPSLYVIADPSFWRHDVNSDLAMSNQLLINNLMNVSWPMDLICTEEGFLYFKKVLEGNSNITVVSLRDNWIDFRSKKINILALKFRLITPNFVNVLVAALWFGMISGRKKIHIYGADFSSFKAFEVDQRTNCLNTEYTHFYTENVNKEVAKEKYPGMKPKNIATRLNQISLAFREMYFLSKVANNWGIKIINKSYYSLLDCFERQ